MITLVCSKIDKTKVLYEGQYYSFDEYCQAGVLIVCLNKLQL